MRQHMEMVKRIQKELEDKEKYEKSRKRKKADKK